MCIHCIDKETLNCLKEYNKSHYQYNDIIIPDKMDSKN